MSKKVYLIDGSGYIFRAYYGVQQALSNRSGLPTNALFGFTKMLLRFLRELKAEHGEPPLNIAMIFDAGRKNYRHDLYSEYKANRSECPEDLVPQMPYFRLLARALGFPVFEEVGFEADDLIASFVRSARDGGHQVVIISADKDLTQLVTPDIIMWDPMRDITFNEKRVNEQFGVPPSLIADYLSLVGDASDNIPGAKGVGPKTAVQLLNHFNSLDDLLSRVGEVSELNGLRGAKGVQAKIESSLDLIRLSRDLVRLEDTVPMNIDSAVWCGYDEDKLLPLLDELDFRSLFKEFAEVSPGIEEISMQEADSSAEESLVEQYSDEAKNSRNTEISGRKTGLSDGRDRIISSPNQHKDYRLVSIGELSELLSETPPGAFFGIDSETDSLDPLKANLLGVSVSWVPFQAYYIDVSDPRSKRTDIKLSDELCKLLQPYLDNPSLSKCGSNLKYDMRVLSRYGFRLSSPLFDTMVASYVLHPDSREHGLKALALKYLNDQMKSFKELTDGRDGLFTVPGEELAQYAAHDADASLRLALYLKEELLKDESSNSSEEQSTSQWNVFKNIEMPLVPILAQMEDDGIKVDVDALQDLEQGFSEELTTLTLKIYEEAGVEFNINSPKQLANVLFDTLGLSTAGLKKTQSGFSTDVGTLMKLQGVHPVVDYLMEYREIHKLQTTYVQALQRLKNEETGRIHASFNQAVAATGRLSSSDPNLQNIPIRTERGRKLRTVFVAEEGCSIITVDYSQIELRVLAHLSGDENLCQAFQDGEDVHLRTARELFGDLVEDDLSKYRRIAKTINFGIIYGMSAFRLAGDLGVSRSEAQEFIRAYFNRYRKVQNYFDTLKEDAEKKGYVETLFGRRRYVADLDMEGRDKGYAARSMMNAPIQGTAAEIVKLAMIRLSEKYMSRRKDVRLVLQVHDELVYEVPDLEAEDLSRQIKKEMEEVVCLKVPLLAEPQIGKNWGKN